MKVVHYAHGGGYTELGGMKEFLTKIRKDVKYERIFPAKFPFKKPINPQRAQRRARESGVSGKRNLFKRLLERLEAKRTDGEKVDILIVIDDTDCRLSDKEERKNFLTSVNGFITKAKSIFKEIKIIFIWAEPEIERWFCLDKASCFRDKPCNGTSLFRELDKLLSIPLVWDKEKKSCKEKFSEKFKEVLTECEISYSKRADGAEYLRKIDPFKIEKRDKFASQGIRKLKMLKE